jgi:hypothetical protein
MNKSKSYNQDINQNLQISNRLAGRWKFRYVGLIHDHAKLSHTRDNECLVTNGQKLSTGNTLTTKALIMKTGEENVISLNRIVNTGNYKV